MKYCCPECFKERELRGLVRMLSEETGTCSYCGSEGQNLTNPELLEEKLSPFLEKYTLKEREPTLAKPLHKWLQKDWNFFSEIISDSTKEQLLLSIFTNTENEIKASSEVSPDLLFDVHSWGKKKAWKDFTQEIKKINRFHLNNSIDLDLLKGLFQRLSITYEPPENFFRARIDVGRKFKRKDLNRPPSDMSTAGRANPKGIPYLYVSKGKRTVIYETRAYHLSKIWIAEIKPVEKVQILKLREISLVSPFVYEEDLEKFLKFQSYLINLEEDLSKPVLQGDNELEYLPTQYLCEFVKSLGYDGIEYGSALQEGGVNIALFNDDKVKIMEPERYQVTHKMDFTPSPYSN